MITGGRAARGGASRSGRGSRRSGRLFGQRRAEASLFAHREPDCPPGRWLSRARWFEPCFDINNCRSCHLSWKLMVQQAGNFVLLSANDSGVIALLYEGRKRRKREKRKRKKKSLCASRSSVCVRLHLGRGVKQPRTWTSSKRLENTTFFLRNNMPFNGLYSLCTPHITRHPTSWCYSSNSYGSRWQSAFSLVAEHTISLSLLKLDLDFHSFMSSLGIKCYSLMLSSAVINFIHNSNISK